MDRVGKFAAGILIARIPILGFQAVQAALLPKLANLAGAGLANEFRSTLRSTLRRLVIIVVAVGIIGVAGSFTLGHFAGRLFFGTNFTLGQPRSRVACCRKRRVYLRADARPGAHRPP